MEFYEFNCTNCGYTFRRLSDGPQRSLPCVASDCEGWLEASVVAGDELAHKPWWKLW